MVTIDTLLKSEWVLSQAQGRGNFPTNYMIGRNLKGLGDVLKPFRDGLKQEPMCWASELQEKAPKPKKRGKDEKKAEKPKPTKEQIAKGDEEYSEALKSEVEFTPYRIKIGKICDELKAFSKGRETKTPEQLQELNENFALVLALLDLVTDDE